MNIYQQEIEDGVSGDVISQASVTLHSSVNPINIEVSQETLDAAMACMGVKEYAQEDLYYLSSILVTAGWNKNDDVFSVSELWAAKNTPINKQFNLRHDETDIIGHITNAAVMDLEGNMIDPETAVDQLPASLEIATRAVIYKTWVDPELRERVQELIEEIEDGQWSVSMECMFRGFDYAMIFPDGSAGIIERNEGTAFLTKHLRAYGGTGIYEGHKVGRLLKSFYFSGKGLVRNPANPRSVILAKDTSPFNCSTQNVKITVAEIKDMSKENLQADLDTAKAQLDAAKAELEAVKAELESEKTKVSTLETEKSDLASSLEASEAKVSELETEKSDLETQVSDLTQANEGLTSEKTSLEASLAEANDGLKTASRKALLAEAGVDGEKAEELLAQFEKADDEMFAGVVALLDKSETSEASEDEVEEEEEASAEDLDNVEDVEEESMASSDEDEEAPTGAIASWFKQSVLKTTNKG